MKPGPLIGCECSGRIREEFRKRGYDAVSCDLKPAEDGSRHHIQADILSQLGKGWPLVIAHPPCPRMALSGALRLYRGGRRRNGRDPAKWRELDESALFFSQIFKYTPKGTKLCVENPRQHGHATRRHGQGTGTQSIQPYQFGDDASKLTVLWLRGLPELQPTKYFEPRLICRECKAGNAYGLHRCWACDCEQLLPRWSNQTDSGQNRLAPSEHRSADRVRTYPGIAVAMAEQWGSLL